MRNPPRIDPSPLAAVLAIALAGSVRGWPEPPHELVVELPDGRVPLLVRGFVGALQVCLDGQTSWHFRSPTPPPETVREIIETASRFADERARDALGSFDVARLLCERLPSVHGAWVASIPGVAVPESIALHPRTSHDAAHVAVIAGTTIVPAFAGMFEVATSTRGELERALPDIAAAVHAQMDEFVRNRAISKDMDQLARTLLVRLQEHGLRRLDLRVLGRPSHMFAANPTITGKDGVVEIFARAGEIVAHAGAVGSAGWEGEGDRALLEIDAIVDALARARDLLTFERLRPGHRYRVLENLHDLRAGATVTFDRFDDIDNHYGVCVFRDESGAELRVGGDYSSPRSSPLAEAHRYLRPAGP